MDNNNNKSFRSLLNLPNNNTSHKNFNQKDLLFKEINLYDIFLQDEVEGLLRDPSFNSKLIEEKEEGHTDYSNGYNDNQTSCFDVRKRSSSASSSNSNLLYNRNSLILKFLKLSIEKLKQHKDHTLAKGLEWYNYY